MLLIFLAPFLLHVIVVTFEKFLLKEEMATIQCFGFGVCVGMFGRKSIHYMLVIRKYYMLVIPKS